MTRSREPLLLSASYPKSLTPSDARNNTTQPNLTYYERSLLRKDSAAKRIGGDSFKPVDSCNLCLSTVSEPAACPRGHLYCRECVLSNLISQKAGIDGQRRELERWDEAERRERLDARRAARERVVRDFERGMALGGGGGRRSAEERDGKGTGRFEFDGEGVERVAREAEEKAARTIEAEQVEARKHKLAAFWLPSLTPEAKLGPLKDVKLQTMCHVGGAAHPIRRVFLASGSPQTELILPPHCRGALPALPSLSASCYPIRPLVTVERPSSPSFSPPPPPPPSQSAPPAPANSPTPPPPSSFPPDPLYSPTASPPASSRRRRRPRRRETSRSSAGMSSARPARRPW